MYSLGDCTDIINCDFPFRDNECQDIYACLSEPPILTMIAGAKCKDGVVLVADKKLTKISGGGDPQFKEKVFGDFEHFSLAYTGYEDAFHVFRKAVVGEWLLRFNTTPLGLEDIIPTYASMIKPINLMSCKPRLEVLIGKHSKKNTDLYHIKHDGEYLSMPYAAIGSGKDVTNKICQYLQFDQLTMKEFAKYAYLAIMYMDQYCPGLGVGVKAGDTPRVRYLSYDGERDLDATVTDIQEFKKYTDAKLEQVRQMFKTFTQ